MAINNHNHPSIAAALREHFSIAAQRTAHYTGHPLAFLTAMGIVVVWAITGPIFNYSDTWQLVINTGTTIVTFLMVFLIQNTQNRDTLAIQLKLSELVFAQKDAENRYAALETMTDDELEELHKEFCKRAEVALANLEGRRKGKSEPAAADNKPAAANSKPAAKKAARKKS
jgi:low affinity Fe/Cu permease